MTRNLKSIVGLLLALCLVFSLVATAFAQTDTVTIAAGESKKGKGSASKADAQAEASVNAKTISSATTIKCYLWRLDPGAQVSGTPSLNKNVETEVKYSNSGNKKKGDLYRVVFVKSTQTVATKVDIGFEFYP